MTVRSPPHLPWTCLAMTCTLMACATPQHGPMVQADAAFAGGRHNEAASAYASVAERSKDKDEALRARLFALLAQRAASGPDNLDRVLSELRSMAVSAGHSPWGRLAGIYADEIAQGEALRWALQRAGADLGTRDVRIANVESELSKKEQEATDLFASLEAMKDERAQQQRSVKELEEQLVTKEASIANLEAELAALKRIDMSRDP